MSIASDRLLQLLVDQVKGLEARVQQLERQVFDAAPRPQEKRGAPRRS